MVFTSLTLSLLLLQSAQVRVRTEGNLGSALEGRGKSCVFKLDPVLKCKMTSDPLDLYVSSLLQEWRSHQFYVLPNWKGGLYASPTLAGSRPGALIAGCWAVMMYHGESGYIASCQKIMETAKHIKSALSSSLILSAQLEVLGDPLSTVIAFTSRSTPSTGGTPINMYALGDRMSKRGWHLNALEGPAALHIACTMVSCSSHLAFLDVQPKQYQADLEHLHGLLVAHEWRGSHQRSRDRCSRGADRESSGQGERRKGG